MMCIGLVYPNGIAIGIGKRDTMSYGMPGRRIKGNQTRDEKRVVKGQGNKTAVYSSARAARAQKDSFFLFRLQFLHVSF
jgi:hypothetical protein